MPMWSSCLGVLLSRLKHLRDPPPKVTFDNGACGADLQATGDTNQRQVGAGNQISEWAWGVGARAIAGSRRGRLKDVSTWGTWPVPWPWFIERHLI